MLLDLVDANREQLSLLDTPEREAQRERDHKLIATLGELNRKMGNGAVRLGVPYTAVDDAVAGATEGSRIRRKGRGHDGIMKIHYPYGHA